MPVELEHLRVRAASIEDRDLLVDLGRRTFFDTFVGTCTDEDMDLFLKTSYAPAKVEEELLAPGSWYLILEGAGAALGFSRLWIDPEQPGFLGSEPAIELVRFYLDQPAIGTGAARVLMQATLDLAKHEGFERMYLGVWERNFRAQKFYSKWGFEKVGEKVFLVGTDPQTDWFYLRTEGR